MKILNHKIEQITFIKAPIEKVYETITSADGWDAFFTTGMILDLKPGGKILFKWVDWGPMFYNVEDEGKIIEFQEPNLFVFEWQSVKDHRSRIEIKLENKYGGTVLTLTEQGYPDTEKGIERMLGCASGWGEAITLLKFYLEFNVVYTQPQKEMN